MEIEWATVCREVDISDPPHVHLMDANSKGALLTGGLGEGITITVTLAVCILCTPEEAQAGGVINAVYGVFAPDGERVVGGQRFVWALEDGDPMYPELDRRTIVPCEVPFNAAEEGVYSILLRIEKGPVTQLPFIVRCLPEP